MRSAIFVLLGAALLLMAATLALVFRTRLRLLPLALALAAAAMTYGALSLAGGGLTMASIAVLPVLIGLAVDYAIQFQARHDEARGRGLDEREAAARRPRPAGRRSPPRAWPPPSASWCCCCRRCRWCAASARWWCSASCWRWRARSPPASPRWCASAATEQRPACSRACAPARGAAATGSPAPGRAQAVARRWARVRLWGVERGERGAGLRGAPPAAGAGGGPRRGRRWAWPVDTQSEVVSDVRELVPRDLQALKDVNTLQDETGVAGEIDVTVRADDITGPEVIAWMTKFQTAR